MRLGLHKKKKEAGNVWSFFFEPLEPTKWLAGQSIKLELPGAKWGIDERRFTIASAPHEAHLQITTRMSASNFKQRLGALKTGEMIDAYAIEGDFIWGDGTGPRLFIAAGLGITPFRSMLSQAIHDGTKLNTTLLYAHKESPAVFKNELDAWQTTDPSLFVQYLAGSRLDFDKNSSLPSYWQENHICISGPEQMVRDISRKLIDLDVPESHLQTDQFTGYSDT